MLHSIFQYERHKSLISALAPCFSIILVRRKAVRKLLVARSLALFSLFRCIRREEASYSEGAAPLLPSLCLAAKELKNGGKIVRARMNF
jgi:hypothetical protein